MNTTGSGRLVGMLLAALSAAVLLEAVSAQTPKPGGDGLRRSAEELHGAGMRYADAGRYEEAVKLIGEAVRVRPDYALAYNDLGYVHQAFGRYAEAVAG